MPTARVRFPSLASADMGFFSLEKLLSLLVSAPRHYKGRVGALHALVYLHGRTLSVWCSLKLSVCFRTHKTHYTDFKEPVSVSENYLKVRNTYRHPACNAWESVQKSEIPGESECCILCRITVSEAVSFHIDHASSHLRAMGMHCKVHYKLFVIS